MCIDKLGHQPRLHGQQILPAERGREFGKRKAVSSAAQSSFGSLQCQPTASSSAQVAELALKSWVLVYLLIPHCCSLHTQKS